jgi:hypothetical protein
VSRGHLLGSALLDCALAEPIDELCSCNSHGRNAQKAAAVMIDFADIDPSPMDLTQLAFMSRLFVSNVGIGVGLAQKKRLALELLDSQRITDTTHCVD